MNKIRLLIASDFRLARTGLRHIVNAVEDVEVIAESELQRIFQQVEAISSDVVLLDLAISRPQNVPAVAQLLKNKQTKVVVMCTNENVGYARPKS